MRKLLIGLMVLGLVGMCSAGIRDVWGGYLKQSTAVNIIVGPFEDDAGDGVMVVPVAAETGITIIKSDSTYVEDTNLSDGHVLTVITGTAAPDTYASYAMLAADVDVLGDLVVVFYHTDLQEPLTYRFKVVTAKAYNLLTSGTVDVDTILTAAPFDNMTDSVDVATINRVAPATKAEVATALWQDTTAGDFTTASSIGKSLYTTGAAPGAAGGLAIVGSDMGISATEATQIAAANWNALVADYTTSGTYGLQVGASGGMVAPPGDTVASGTAQGGSTNYITLAAADTATSDVYKGYSIRLVDVTDGYIQVRTIASYDHDTKIAYITPNWVSGREPTSSDTYTIAAPALPGGSMSEDMSAKQFVLLVGAMNFITQGDARVVHTNTTLTMQLEDSGTGDPQLVSPVADYYNGYIVHIYLGTGIGQYRFITDYSGHSSTGANDNYITIDYPFTVVPDGTSSYRIYKSFYASIASSFSLGSAIEDTTGGKTSTTSTIYLSSAASALLVTPGAVLEWQGTGLYKVYGVVKSVDSTRKIVSLYSPAIEAPSDGTTINVVEFMNTGYWNYLNAVAPN